MEGLGTVLERIALCAGLIESSGDGSVDDSSSRKNIHEEHVVTQWLEGPGSGRWLAVIENYRDSPDSESHRLDWMKKLKRGSILLLSDDPKSLRSFHRRCKFF